MKEKLIEQAKHIREKAYTPYSNFNVGAALLTKSREIYTGCNIENASYPVSCCAERVAIFNAISEGHKQFQGMAVVADTNGPVRSEEHTSELQSRGQLVCRLLLEKKKSTASRNATSAPRAWARATLWTL